MDILKKNIDLKSGGITAGGQQERSAGATSQWTEP